MDSREDHTAIIRDLNVTLNTSLDKVDYKEDHHWTCWQIINEWIDSGALQEDFRHLNPEINSNT